MRCRERRPRSSPKLPPTVANVLQLRAFAEPGGSVHAALLVHGHLVPFNAIFRSDGLPLAPCVSDVGAVQQVLGAVR